MTAGIQLTGIVQPSPDMIYDQNYEKGEKLLPKQAGQWTLFSVQPLFTKEDDDLPIQRDYNAGHPVGGPCQATWLAADQVAYKYSVGLLIAQQEKQRQAAVAHAAKPKLVLPQLG